MLGELKDQKLYVLGSELFASQARMDIDIFLVPTLLLGRGKE